MTGSIQGRDMIVRQKGPRSAAPPRGTMMRSSAIIVECGQFAGVEGINRRAGCDPQ